MPPKSPQEFREEVRSHSDIVGLISESVALQPRSGGREYVGLCPFHDDHNPSMRVYPERQTFRCWSCNTGGDCFTYVCEREKVTFPESLEILARRAHLEIPKYVSGKSPEQASNRAKLFEVLQWAEGEFMQTLLGAPTAEPAREYLLGRGIDEEVIRWFRLGFNPGGQWLLRRAKGKYSEKLLLDVCLVGENDGGGYYDFFSHRIMFPIHNERGQAVSFSGRILPGSDHPAKYKNGRETQVFHKSRLLYALDLAREEIRAQAEAIVVEGYTDCIALHQRGVTNAVVTMGTALTDEQVTTIKRFARKVVLVFDGDQAGQDAAARAVERFLAQDVDLRILTPPNQLDPADYLEQAGVEAFRELVKEAPQAWDFRFRAAQAKYGFASIDARQQVLNEMLQVLARVPEMASSVREPLLVANLAQKMGLTEGVVRKQLKELRTTGQSRTRMENHAVEERTFASEVQRIQRGLLASGERVECDLLQNVLAVPEAFCFVEEVVTLAPLRNQILKGVLRKCSEAYWANGEIRLSCLLDQMPDRDLKSLVVWLDEQAASKGLAHKMKESGVDEKGCPQLLRQSIEALQSREERHLNQNVAVQLSQSTDGPAQLNEATEALLRQAAEFHQKRATKKNNV